MWVRADAVTGYFCDFEVYVGKSSDGDSPEVGLGERVVLQLCRQLQGGNYQVFCDNFFSTVALFDKLLQQIIYACGTTRIDRRGFPDTLKNVALEDGAARVMPAWKPYSDSVEGQETCEDAVHNVQSTHNVICGEKAERWE